jgi:hypothetical protein
MVWICWWSKLLTMSFTAKKILINKEESLEWLDTTVPHTGSVPFWTSIAYGNGVFVIVADTNNQSAYSSDGINWTSSSMPSALRWVSIAFGSNKFIAIEKETNKFASSSNGISWTLGNLPSSGNWNSITYNDNKFVIVGLNKAAYSTDGITWTTTTIPSGNYTFVEYGGGRFVAVRFSSESYMSSYSTNGITWIQGDTFTFRFNPDFLTYGNGYFIAVAGNNAIMVSNEGSYWYPVSANGINSRHVIKYGGNKFACSVNGFSDFVGNGFFYSVENFSFKVTRNNYNRIRTYLSYGNERFVSIGQQSNIILYTK